MFLRGNSMRKVYLFKYVKDIFFKSVIKSNISNNSIILKEACKELILSVIHI